MMGEDPKQTVAAELKATDPHGMGIQLWIISLLASPKVASLVLSLLLFWVCTFTGCTLKEDLELDSLSPDQRKIALLEQLNRKFENPDAHFELGQLYQAQGQWAKAEYHYNVALRFEPAHRDAQAAMVKGLADNGKQAEAEQYAKAYMNQVWRLLAALLQLAGAFDRQGLDEYALACYQRALSLAPESPEVNKQLGYYYLNNDDKTQAKEYFSRSFQLNPNQPDVAGELGRLGVVVKIPRKADESAQNPDEGAE